jgi:hypothetical protein
MVFCQNPDNNKREKVITPMAIAAIALLHITVQEQTIIVKTTLSAPERADSITG